MVTETRQTVVDMYGNLLGVHAKGRSATKICITILSIRFGPSWNPSGRAYSLDLVNSLVALLYNPPEIREARFRIQKPL